MKKLILSLMSVILLSGCVNIGTNLEGKKCPDGILRQGNYQAFDLKGGEMNWNTVGILKYNVEETPDMWKILWEVDLDYNSWLTNLHKNGMTGVAGFVLMDRNYMVKVHVGGDKEITCTKRGCDEEINTLTLKKEHFDISTIKWVTFGYKPVMAF